MGFFNLNILYLEPTPTTKSSIEPNRTKLAVKAMELGYTGIAYNRTIKGVMSDHHRCSITPLDHKVCQAPYFGGSMAESTMTSCPFSLLLSFWP